MEYSYICPHCGNTWKSNSYNTNECSICKYWNTICSYTDGDTRINQDEYQQVLTNAENQRKYLMQCADCNKQEYFYFNQWLTCDCGGMMQEVVNQEECIGKLKAYRKNKKLSQEHMAGKFGISRSYYADMEQGKKPLTRGIIHYINKQKTIK